MDNVIASFDSHEELKTFITEATAVMAEGKFDLRSWEYTEQNCYSLCNTSVLGMIWNRRDDTLKINVDNLKFSEGNITKRKIMSAAHRVFDPLGIVSPVTICPKVLIRELWEIKIEWEEPVPEHIQTQFCKWMKELKYLENIQIPRWLIGMTEDIHNVKISIHTFTDASDVAYAAAVFLRIERKYEVKVQLIQSKARIVPVKKITTPRLELLGATVGARLFSSVIKSFDCNYEIYFWTDSSTVIAWLKHSDSWGTFVSNRVQEIRNLTRIEDWHHVPGVLNPADLPSRGCLGKKLAESSWWEGPDWLYKPGTQWLHSKCDFDEEIIFNERKKTTVTYVATTCDTNYEHDWYYKYFSKYEKLIRMIAWIIRFSNNCRASGSDVFVEKRGNLSVDEIKAAEGKILKLIQKESFEGVKDSIASLRPFEDPEGVIRLRTKISNRPDSIDFRYPILLPKDHPVVKRLIRSIHVL